MQSERIDFPGAAGPRLAARLDRPEGPVRATALIAHCFTCSKDLAALRRIAGRLAARGIAALRFDFTGLGHSEGEFGNTGFSSNVADLRAAARWLAGQGMAPGLLIGHSLGGAAAIAAAPDLPGLRALVTIGAPADPAHVLDRLGSGLDTIRRDGRGTVEIGGRSFEIGADFVADVAAASLDRALPRLGAALLVLHAPRDAVVSVDHAARLFAAARHPKSYVALDGADHLVTREADAEYVADLIATWAGRYLDLAAEPEPPEAPEGIVRVAEAEGGGLRQDVSFGGRHQGVVDEPEALGGTGFGPSPYQLLSAALGACTVMTLRLYARHKGLDLGPLACDVRHAKAHARDAGQAADAAGDAGDSDGGEGKGARIDQFHRRLRLPADLAEDDRRRLLAIAERCPVHRTLAGRAVIRTEIAD